MNEIHEYMGYSLDDNSVWELTDKEKRYLDAVIWLVDNKSSLRKTQKEVLVPKTTLWRFIHTKLKAISGELHGCAKRILIKNKG